MYNEFARVYDTLMDDVDYDGWARHYLELIAPAKPRRICECACGTGSLTVRFARAGLQTTGVDLSEDMLRIAQEKARRFGVQTPFVRQDMCALTLPRRVDSRLYMVPSSLLPSADGRPRKHGELRRPLSRFWLSGVSKGS